MPSEYVKKLATKKGVSAKEAERKWDKAKKLAADEGHAEDFAYITGIFKRMMGETSSVLEQTLARLKETE